MSSTPVVWEVLDTFIESKKGDSPRQYRSVLNSWVASLGVTLREGDGARLLSVLPIDVRRYATKARMRPGQMIGGVQYPRVAESTVERKITMLKSLYDELKVNRLIDDNPFDIVLREFRGVTGGTRRPTEGLTDEQLVRVTSFPGMDKEAIRDRAIMATLFYGGLRSSECRNLLISDIQETPSGTLLFRLQNTKNKSDVLHAVSDEVRPFLEPLHSLRRLEGATALDPLFCGYYVDRGYTPDDDIIPPKTFYRIYIKRIREVGIDERITPHSMRATAITKLLESGLNHREVQEFSRHSSVRMVEVYDLRRFELDQSPGKTLKMKK